MKSFGICIWFIPEQSSELYKLTHGFTPHISLETCMGLETGIQKYTSLKRQSISVKLRKVPIRTSESGFNSLQFQVEVLNNKILPLNPKNPHISFKYKYNEEITQYEIDELIKKIDFDKEYIFNSYKLMNCDDHYLNWFTIFSSVFE